MIITGPDGTGLGGGCGLVPTVGELRVVDDVAGLKRSERRICRIA